MATDAQIAAVIALAELGQSSAQIAPTVGLEIGDVASVVAGATFPNPYVPPAGTAAYGEATLSAGTKAIANTAVTAATIVRYSRQAAGGALGHLSIALTPGVGFAVNSSSGTDTSVVYWEIVSY